MTLLTPEELRGIYVNVERHDSCPFLKGKLMTVIPDKNLDALLEHIAAQQEEIEGLRRGEKGLMGEIQDLNAIVHNTALSDRDKASVLEFREHLREKGRKNPSTHPLVFNGIDIVAKHGHLLECFYDKVARVRRDDDFNVLLDRATLEMLVRHIDITGVSK